MDSWGRTAWTRMRAAPLDLAWAMACGSKYSVSVRSVATTILPGAAKALAGWFCGRVMCHLAALRALVNPSFEGHGARRLCSSAQPGVTQITERVRDGVL